MPISFQLMRSVLGDRPVTVVPTKKPAAGRGAGVNIDFCVSTGHLDQLTRQVSIIRRVMLSVTIAAVSVSSFRLEVNAITTSATRIRSRLLGNTALKRKKNKTA